MYLINILTSLAVFFLTAFAVIISAVVVATTVSLFQID